MIGRLKDKALITEVEKGKYLLLGLEPERVLSNPLFIASHLVVPAYFSYWSAPHFHGFTEQVPLTTFVATTKKKRPVRFQDYRFRFVTIRPGKFLAIGEIWSATFRRSWSTKPRPWVDAVTRDSLDLPDYAGGLGEIAKALRAALEIVEVDTLVQYANQMEDKSLGSRLGYLLENLGQPAEGLVKSASPVKLDVSGSRSGETDPHWQVIVNVPEGSLVP